MTLTAGARLGPYEILSSLGAGGMGEVYRARDTRLARDVAIKVLPEHLSSMPDRRQRFEREAKMVAQLSHSHICALHDVGHEGDVDYIVMDCLEGETLFARLLAGPLPIAEALVFGIQISEALDHAHHAGVIHRDLKPGNIFLTKKGVKVLDFGLATRRALPSATAADAELPTETAEVAGPLTEPGTIQGTLPYMAPEQLRGEEADARTDIFAFGVLLYEMVTGRRPFSGKSQPELMSSILRDEPKPLAEIVPLAPPALERLIRQCLAKNPDDRWEAAHDLTNALRWIRDEMSVASSPRPQVEARPGRRHPFAFTAVAFVAIALALAVAVVTYRSFKRSPSGTADLSDSRRIAVLPFEHQGPASEFTLGGCGIWWLIDVILIATNTLRDANGRLPVKRM